MTFDQFQDIVRSQRSDSSERIIVPLHRRRSADLLTPVSAFLHLREGARMPFLLESVEGGEKLARYSFLGRNPYQTVTAEGHTTRIEQPGHEPRTSQESVLDVLDDLIRTYREVQLPDLPRLTGGAVGYFGYDCIRLIE
ncbi:MAG: anthranilate synthase component I, partial [Bacteroidota bacterium]|nr:anthranilate synthase component I [Bacteroidota bacterium]